MHGAVGARWRWDGRNPLEQGLQPNAATPHVLLSLRLLRTRHVKGYAVIKMSGAAPRQGKRRCVLRLPHAHTCLHTCNADCVYGDNPAQGTAGHGTHTAGSMVGALLALQLAPGYNGSVLGGAAGDAAAYGPTGLDAGSGAAPRAKLSFVDISLTAAAAGGLQVCGSGLEHVG